MYVPSESIPSPHPLSYVIYIRQSLDGMSPLPDLTATRAPWESRQKRNQLVETFPVTGLNKYGCGQKLEAPRGPPWSFSCQRQTLHYFFCMRKHTGTACISGKLQNMCCSVLWWHIPSLFFALFVLFLLTKK